MVKITDLTKYYGNYKALNNINFEVKQGEVVGLLGPNGAGKTTALNIITGVLLPDQGRVYIDDRLLTADDLYAKQKIGYLAEDNPQYTSLLVSESLEIAAQLKNLPKEKYQSRLPQIIRLTGLKDIFHQSIETLSKGLRQRVGLAQALLSDPKILILDEPTDGLDANQRQEIRQLVRDLGREHTVLLSTHVMQEVEAVCERVVILNHGVIVADGRVQDITRSQDGYVEVEFSLAGDDPVELVRQLKEVASEINHEADRYLAKLESSRELDFYRQLNSITSNRRYLTSLNKRKVSLEEVFSRLTKE